MEENKKTGGILKERVVRALENREMRKWTKKALIGLLVLIVWIVGLLYFTAEKYPITVRVVEQEAGAEAPSALDFGTLQPGANTSKFVELEAAAGRAYTIRIFILGDAARVTGVENDNFTLYAGSSEKIEVMAEIPESGAKAEYRGTLLVVKLPKLF